MLNHQETIRHLATNAFGRANFLEDSNSDEIDARKLIVVQVKRTYLYLAVYLYPMPTRSSPLRRARLESNAVRNDPPDEDSGSESGNSVYHLAHEESDYQSTNYDGSDIEELESLMSMVMMGDIQSSPTGISTHINFLLY